jgi:eukaryotic-like serine/threonine-protein kinase
MSLSQAWVAERYRLVEPLGAGGMGRVWLARDEVLRRDVAIKEIVPPEGLTEAEREELRMRTLREARAAARLNDPHVVRIYDVVHTERRPWIVMEYVPSRSLHQVITEDGPVPVDRAAHIALSVLAALRAAHAAGVLHRDVKPGNVLLADDGRVVLTDFGLAIFEGGDGAVTRPGLILGSPQYIAPERARDGVSGAEADLWSLGATLYAAVEGRSPYARSTTFATLTALATEDPDPALRAGALKPAINALLRKDPRARAGMAETERLLRRAATGEGRLWPWSLPRPRRSKEIISGDGPSLPSAPEATDEPQLPAVPIQVIGIGALRSPEQLPAAPSPPARRSTKRWIPVAVIVLLLVVAGTVVYTLRDHPTDKAGPVPARSAAPAALTSGKVGDDPVVLPPGFHYYTDPTYHWQIAVPDGWVTAHDPDDPTMTYFDEPTLPKRRLGVGRSTAPPGDPVSAFTRLEQQRVGGDELPGYKKVRLQAVPYYQAAADWVYTYNGTTGPLEVCDRGFTVNDHLAHAIVWLTPAEQWNDNLTNWNLFTVSFHPGN